MNLGNEKEFKHVKVVNQTGGVIRSEVVIVDRHDESGSVKESDLKAVTYEDAIGDRTELMKIYRQ